MGNKSITKNFIYSSAYQILAIIVPLITSPYLSRVLGAEMIGINSWTYSIVYYFMIFTMLGISNYGNRTIATVRDNKNQLSRTFCSIYICQFLLGILMIIFYSIYISFFATKYKFILILQGFFILSNMFDVTWFFYGLEDFKLVVLRNSFVKLLSLICIFLFVKTQSDLWKYTLINAGTTFLGQLIVWPTILKTVKLKIPNINEVIPHIKPILILFIPVLAISIFTNMDKYMIGQMSNVVESGLYENTDKIISIPKAIITALGTVMLPRTANLIANNQEDKSIQYMKNTILYTMIMSSALAFGMAAVSNIFSIVFWGEEFTECGRLIACMSPAIVFSVLGNVIRTQYLIPRSKDKEYTVSLIIGAIVNVSFNWYLIPKLGALGAVIGTVIAEFIMTFIQFEFVSKQLNIIPYLKNGVIFYVIGLIMYLLVKCLETLLNVSVLSLVIEILVGAIIYICLCILVIFNFKNESIVSLKINILNFIKNK